MTSEQNILSILSENRIFSVLSDSELSDILSDDRCKFERYNSGDTVYDSDSFMRAVGIICDGKIRVSRVGSGNRVTLNILSRGELFGVAALFGDEDSFVTSVTAAEKSEIFFIPDAVIRKLIRTNSGFAFAYIGFLSDKIRFLNRRIAEFTAGSTKCKLAEYLISHENDCDMSMVQLASALGMGRASLYREIDELTSRGFIRKDGRKIIVLDREGLESVL